MTENEMESGFELVLDNRRLIGAFVVFIVICGCFFVLGYATGKRQGEIAAVGSLTDRGESAFVPSSGSEDAISEDLSNNESESQEDLDWYQNINRRGNDETDIPPPRKSTSAAKSSVPVAAGPVTYSVQVGAFKARQQADSYATAIEAKGFKSRVEAPSASNAFYLVKVGNFKTREEANTKLLDLTKNGFTGGYVKTN
ncbi:MAG: SPOR domain-containing protein [Acidobacteriota bacterium]|jgi:septal ring-binding cell division protein DamX